MPETKAVRNRTVLPVREEEVWICKYSFEVMSVDLLAN